MKIKDSPGLTLAIDTAMDQCAAALLDPSSGLLAQRTEACLHGHAGRLVPMIEDLIHESHAHYDQIGLIAVTTGPGSFTGIRAGLSCARGLALALDVPLRGFGTLEALARQAIDADGKDDHCSAILVLIETRRDNFFAQTFNANGQALDPPQDNPAAKITLTPETILAGDGAKRFLSLRADAQNLRIIESARNIDPASLARWAAQEQTASAPPRPAIPLYVRPADVHGHMSAPTTR